MNRIGVALSSEHNLDTLLEMILREVRGFTHADAGSLYIREAERLRFTVAQNDTLSKRGNVQPFKSFYIEISKTSIAGFVAATGRLVNIKDAYRIPKSFNFSFDRSFDERMDYRTRSILTIPMKDHQAETIGVLQLINALDGEGRLSSFSREDEELASSLASQAAMAIRNARLIQEIKDLFRALVEYSVSAIDARSPHTAGHSRRVCQYTLSLAGAVNAQIEGPYAKVYLNEEELEELSFAAWLHDIGKIGVREWVLEKRNRLSEGWMEAITNRFNYLKERVNNEILIKKNRLLSDGVYDEQDFRELERRQGEAISALKEDLDFIRRINTSNLASDEDLERLDRIQKRSWLSPFEYENLAVRAGNLRDEERREIQLHVEHTMNILSKLPFPKNLVHIPLYAGCHHEMLDGKGYPHGLTGEAIPLQARILAVVDIFDALTAADRPYKKAVPIEKVLDILRDEAAKGHLDKDLVGLFIQERVWEGVLP